MSDKAERAKSIFLDAIAKPRADWPALLDQACAGDAELRATVEQLLRAQAELGSFHEQHPPSPSGRRAGGEGFGPTQDDPICERPGTVIGPYKLLQKLGEGGMGVVWMAEQTHPVQRKVALKVIKPGMDSRQVIARFEAERQALALMDHVNIARVFDGGVVGQAAGLPESRQASGLPHGRPFFVMELVHGVPITKYCDDNHLTPRERLELFVPVCQAIQHAHQKGIIHRDIKPSNVMVTLYDGKPVPKVIDFGVAKATEQKLTERTLFTQYGTMVGTLEYMSPEQAEMSALGVDTRSDIYSLGVLLYELLTGSTPLTRKRLKEAAFGEILRIIKEEEPPRPSTRLSDSGEALASISANRQTEPAKLTKLVRGELDWIVMKCLEKDRNRRYETANGFAMDVQRYLADEPVLACPPSMGYRLRKFARRNKAGLAVAALVLFFLVLLGSGVGWAVRDRAARQAEVARQIESILAGVDRLEAERKWPDALAAARRAEAAATGGGADAVTEQRVRERLRDLEFVEHLEKIRISWVSTQVEWDREYARAFRDFGVDIDELPVESSIERLGKRPQLAVAIASALDGWLIHRRALPAGGDAGWKRLVDIARGIDPDPLRDRVRATRGRPVLEVREEVRKLVESIEVRAHPPESITALVDVLRRVDLRVAAIRVLQEAQALHPRDFWINYDLAVELSEQGDHAGAVRYASVAASIRPVEWPVHHLLGICLRGQGKLDEAVAAFRKSIDLIPKDSNIYPRPLINLGHALRAQGKPDEAAMAFRKLVERDPSNPQHRLDLGHDLRTLGKRAEADAAFGKAVELARQALDRNPQDSDAWVRLGWGLRDLGKPDEAIDAYRKAIELAPTNLAAIHGLAKALHAQGKVDEVIEIYGKAIEHDTKNASLCLHNLAFHLMEQGKMGEAEAAHRRAIGLNPRNAGAYHGLGVALSAQGKFDEAIEANCRAIDIDPGSFEHFNNLGAVLGKKGMPGAAADAFAVAAANDPKRAQGYANLGGALYQQQKWAEAIAAYGKFIGLDPTSVVGHRYRGAAYAALGLWDKAAADYDRWRELDPKVHDAWLGAAYAYLAAGDAEGYCRTCRGLVERFGRTEDPAIAERTAKACSAAPGAVLDFGVVENLAQRAVTGTEKHGYRRYFVLAKGLTENRAGRHAAAVTWLERFAPDARRGADFDAIAFAALAAARHRLGRTDDARDALAKAKAIVADKMPDPAKGRPFAGNWTDWVHAQLLTREAEELMKEKAEVK